MNKYQIARNESNQLVVIEARNNQDSVNQIPAFAKGMNRLDEINKRVLYLQIQQEKDTSGVTTYKKESINDLIDMFMDISGAAHSYALELKDSVLLSKIDYTITTVKNFTLPKLLSAAGIVLESVKTIPAEAMQEQGIAASEVNDFDVLLQKVQTVKTQPQEISIDRVQITEEIASLLSESIELLNNKLDKLATQFKRKDSVFYQKYKTARTVSVIVNHKPTTTNTTAGSSTESQK